MISRGRDGTMSVPPALAGGKSRVGEWASGRVGEWASGRVGEWTSGRVRNGSGSDRAARRKDETAVR